MKVISTIIAGAILTVSAISSVSAAAVVFKNPVGWAGTGCKANAVSVNGANTSSLSVFFDAYEAGKDHAKQKRRVACNFAVPIQVPRGFQVSHLTADWEVYAEGRGQFSRKYFIAGHPRYNWKRQNLNGGSNGKNWSTRDNLYHATFATGCNGGKFNLRISSEIKANNRRKDYIAVDAVDLKNKVLFLVKFRRC